MVKFKAWEGLVTERIEKMRIEEGKLLVKVVLLKGINTSLFIIFSMAISLVCFFVHNIVYKQKLEISSVYSLISIFAWITSPLRHALMSL